jgi:hypothetical protein
MKALINNAKDTLNAALSQVREKFSNAIVEISDQEQAEAAKLAAELEIIANFENYSSQKDKAEASLESLKDTLKHFQADNATPQIDSTVDQMVHNMGQPYGGEAWTTSMFQNLFSRLSLADTAKKHSSTIVDDFTRKYVAVRRQNLENFKIEYADVLRRHGLI